MTHETVRLCTLQVSSTEPLEIEQSLMADMTFKLSR